MITAALVLASALVVAPGAGRQGRARLGLSGPLRRRPPVAPVAALGAAVLVWLLPLPVVLAVAVAVATGLLRRRSRRAERRRAEESVAIQGALEVLVGELRVGVHPVPAFETTAREIGGEVGAALHAVAARARLGADVAAGLRAVAVRSALPAHWERLAVCWQLAQSHGLAIATLMRTAQRDVIERERFWAKVRAGMAGPRTTAAVLAGLPGLGVGLGQAIGAEPVRFLLSSGVGGWLLTIGIALACAGLLWSDRITAGALR